MFTCEDLQPSSETQGQIVGARESLNRRKNIYGTKKSKERREEPLGTMSYETSSKRSPPFWLLIGARKLVFFWHQSEARTAATVWNWSGKTLSPGALLAVLYFSLFHIYFSARLDFPSSPLSAPGSPRMIYNLTIAKWLIVYRMHMKSRLLGTSLLIDDPWSKKLVFGPILAHETSIFQLQNNA